MDKLIQNFAYVKVLTRHLAKVHNIKSEADWKKYTESKDFQTNFKNVLPLNPEKYFSKANVLRRRDKKEKRRN